MTTRIADVVVPDVFVPYMLERTRELSAFFSSGIITEGGADLGQNLTKGGHTVNMPFWQDLHNPSEELTNDDTALTVNKIKAEKDIALVQFRGGAWGANELTHQLAGADPMRAIADLIAEWWNRQLQGILISTLDGAFAAANMANSIHDISGASGEAAFITGKTFLRASQCLGDAKSQIAAIGMHSATQTYLGQRDLIQTMRDSQGRYLFETFMGKRIIIDDGMPVSGDVYTTYLFGAGAIGFSEGGVLNPLETDRDILVGDDVITTRRAFVMHPRGIKWKGSIAGDSPTHAELKAGANWERVYEQKGIRMIKFVHKIDID